LDCRESVGAKRTSLIGRLLRTITVNGEMVAVSSAQAVHAQTGSTLGRHLQRRPRHVGTLDEIEEQKL